MAACLLACASSSTPTISSVKKAPVLVTFEHRKLDCTDADSVTAGGLGLRLRLRPEASVEDCLSSSELALRRDSGCSDP